MSDSLLDVAPISELVPVSDKRIKVSGISLREFINLLMRFPPMLQILSERKELNARDLILALPEASSAVIAAGAGEAGNKKVEQAIDNLVVGDQVELLSTIITLTLPRGFGPLVEKVEALANLVGNVPKVSTATEQLKGNSQDQSNS